MRESRWGKLRYWITLFIIFSPCWKQDRQSQPWFAYDVLVITVKENGLEKGLSLIPFKSIDSVNSGEKNSTKGQLEMEGIAMRTVNDTGTKYLLF